MATDILVPTLGESVSEATIGRWFKKPGDTVAADEPLVELETDKVTLEVNAPAAGRRDGGAGRRARLDRRGLGRAQEGRGQGGNQGCSEGGPEAGRRDQDGEGPRGQCRLRQPRRARSGAAASGGRPRPGRGQARPRVGRGSVAGRRLRQGWPRDQGRHARRHRQGRHRPGEGSPPERAAGPVRPRRRLPRGARADDEAPPDHRAPPEGRAGHGGDADDVQRRRHVRRDGDAQPVQGHLREEARHEARLYGLLHQGGDRRPEGRAGGECRDRRAGPRLQELLPIGIAVGTDKGLVVPVVRDADDLSIAGIEKKIAGFGKKAREGKLSIEEMQGGTFTITNGGIYGSLMSTPILNAPQSGILGMHRIEERPVVRNGKIEARPMMYLALSYDHRIVDGKEAVTFLVRVKEALEDPGRIVLDL
ncbi:hypothetical protein Lal_00046464 [Lupinus albus]|nr:hypothetical protein Lal_00046464 [Lupinus albus]